MPPERKNAQPGTKLLINTDFSIGHIAALSGFDCASYFHRKFKCEVGCTPNEFRRRAALEPSADIPGTHP